GTPPRGCGGMKMGNAPVWSVPLPCVVVNFPPFRRMLHPAVASSRSDRTIVASWLFDKTPLHQDTPTKKIN
ncbi:MAG: hypothetical protein IJS46_05295, partial [Kiritimatiellae bacterium]|nr:hypothetical protein [Kiritimatiellia bacterium]